MRASFRPQMDSAKMFSYAESKKLFEIYQNILERFAMDRPNEPLAYLYDLLTKEAVYDVPKVYVLGPPSTDRTLVCTTLALKLGLMHVTYESLVFEENERKITSSRLVDLIKKRVEKPDCSRCGWILEGLPTTRYEAFVLRQKGVLSTHVEMLEETKVYLSQIPLILNLHKNSHLKTFIVESDQDSTVEKALEFVRSKMSPPLPYLPRVLIFGPYGSGRRTVARRLVEKYHLVEVPEDLLVEIASTRLMQKDCIEQGWIMYNFPDTVEQAEILTKSLEGFQVNRVIFLDSSVQTCLDRVEPRRLDPTSGKMYHCRYNPCEQRSLMDQLIQLPQDTAESVEAEYRFYLENVEQLKNFYRQELPTDITVEVDANLSEEEIFEAVQGAVLKSTKMKLKE